MKRNNSGDVSAKKQRKQQAAKARRARRKEKFTAQFLRKARGLLLKVSKLESEIKMLKAAALPAPEVKNEP